MKIDHHLAKPLLCQSARRLVFPFLVFALLAVPGLAADCDTPAGPDGGRFVVSHRDGKKQLRFNDVGCALVWREKQCTSRQMTFDGSALAHDFLSGAEVPVAKGYFVRHSDTAPPGGDSILAFAEEAAAREYVAGHGGTVLSYDDLLKENLSAP